MRNIKLILSYDGTDFHGWQRQPGLRTVQQVLEEAIGKLTGRESTTTASGRTDAGVHALGQVVHFYTPASYPPEVFVRALNAYLPRDARVLDASEMPQTFHATLDAKSKHYRYQVDNHPIADPFLRRHAWHVPQSLDVPAMSRAARALLGRHDFRSFETNWPNRTSSVRTIVRVGAERVDRLVRVDVEADGFLYNMVRAITGTLVMVGKGLWTEDRVASALKAEDRREAGPTAPPEGLFLVTVRY
jgi:tRNA pseudouridine38-40 synthase